VRQPLGQHFLRDPRVVETILQAAELKPTDLALEIGPGKGVLTEPLSARVAQLVAVELDRTLAPRLTERFAARPSVRIVQADFLKTDLPDLFPKTPIKVLGNLPYSITAPIFEKLLAWPGWETGVFLIQREVGERIRAQAGSRTFGILSLAVQLFADVELIAQVKPGAFVPPPKVTSVVIRLRRKPALPLAAETMPAFFDLAHAAFSHRRKTLANSLALFSGIDKKKIETWLASQRIAATARAESLALAEYLRLSDPWRIFRREMNLTSD
jgi:16S rRNA (adenine1518-N6/adenine1519-N6)-dimethyltransferase